MITQTTHKATPPNRHPIGFWSWMRLLYGSCGILLIIVVLVMSEAP